MQGSTATTDGMPPSEEAGVWIVKGADSAAERAPEFPLVEEQNNRVKRCRHGLMLYNRLDAYIGRSFDLYGEFSEGETAVFAQIVPKGGIVLDVGANIGAHTIPMARMVGEAGRVVAIEPQRIIHQMLCANVALNALTNVSAIWAGAGQESGTMRVPPINYAAEENFGGVSLANGEQGEIVQILRLDSLQLPACHFIKIDVEGMEAEVIAGARRLLERWRPILYVENDREDKSKHLVSELLSLKYRLYWHITPLFREDNFYRSTTNIFGHMGSFNMLCVPQENPSVMNGFQEIKSPDERHPMSRSAP
jgi:FkbM family methyltransferase